MGVPIISMQEMNQMNLYGFKLDLGMQQPLWCLMGKPT